MVKKSASDWYNRVIKKGSKTVEEELKHCKEAFEIFFDLAQEKPGFIEEFLWELQEIDGLDVDQKVIEEALCDLLNDVGSSFPLRDLIMMYIEDKDRFDLLMEHDKAARKCLNALSFIFIPVGHVPPKETEELHGRLESGDISEEQWVRSYGELHRKYDVKSITERLGLHKSLMHNILEAYLLIKAANSLCFSKFGSRYAHGMLLRSALEFALKAMLFEHLLKDEFRKQVQQKYWLGKKDDVTVFLKRATNEADRSGARIEDVIRERYLELSERPIFLRFGHVLEWLHKWRVFRPIPDAKKKLKNYKATLDKEVHGELLKSTIRVTLRYYRLDLFLEEIMRIVEFILVGTINTATNIASDIHERLRSLRKVEGVDAKKTVYDEFLEHLRNASLKYSEKRLVDLASS